MGDPFLIVLDEMSTGVDPQVRRFMWDVLLDVVRRRSHTAVILTSHNLEGKLQPLATVFAYSAGGLWPIC